MYHFGCFIFGDKAETYESAQKTLQWWRDHRQYNVHMTLIKPYPGTEIYKWCLQKGIIKDPVVPVKIPLVEKTVSLKKIDFLFLIEKFFFIKTIKL